jgi:crotonobetainyl-CoA:carnitine CoA-transferase CaiB-like acyl-CoA transferase
MPIGGYALMEFTLNGRDAERPGNRSAWFAPQGCYPCKGNDAWLVITVRDDAEWRAFAEATGHPAWAEQARFADVLGRHRHHDELDQLISEWTREREGIEAMRLLQASGVTAAAVLNPKQVLFDEQLRARSYFDEVEQSGAKRFVPKQLGARFSAFDVGARGPAPKLGEHNREVLQGMLGLSDEELAELEAAKAIGETPEFGVPLPVIRMFVQWPLTSMLQMGSLAAVEPDYREQLGSG